MIQNALKFQIGLRRLKAEGVVFPHRVDPLHFPGGNVQIESEAEWNSHQWNPPQLAIRYSPQRYPDILDEDFTADEKPTWAQILAAYARVTEEPERASAIERVRDHCRDRITKAAYLADSLEEETQRRQRLKESNPEALTRMDKWRDHYRQRYREIAYWISQQGSTLADIENFQTLDFTDSVYWDAADWTPPGAAEAFSDHAEVPDYVDDVLAADPPQREAE